MISTGWIRGMMSKSMKLEYFLIRVSKVIESQLKKWDENYQGAV